MTADKHRFALVVRNQPGNLRDGFSQLVAPVWGAPGRRLPPAVGRCIGSYHGDPAQISRPQERLPAPAVIADAVEEDQDCGPWHACRV